MAERTNLINQDNPGKYIVLSVLLLVLSGVGIYWLLQNKKETVIEKEVLVVKSETATATVTPSLSATPTAEISVTATASVTPKPTIKEIESFTSTEGGFSVKYSGLRKFYEENEPSGKRYVFFKYDGNITVHVGKTWSWKYPGRTFTDEQMVDGLNSSVYEISNQKLVDFEKGEIKYSIQCVHNMQKTLKDECQKFIEDFKFI